MALRCVRDVVHAVARGVVVGISVNANHAEVTCMTRPHPIVGVTTVFAYAFWWGSHQANVVVILVSEYIELVAVVHRLHVVTVIGVGRHVFALNGLEFIGHSRRTFTLLHVIVDLGEDPFGDVVDANEEAYKEVVDVHFLILGFGPESIGQIVVLRRTETLNGTVGTVMICEHQAL